MRCCPRRRWRSFAAPAVCGCAAAARGPPSSRSRPLLGLAVSLSALGLGSRARSLGSALRVSACALRACSVLEMRGARRSAFGFGGARSCRVPHRARLLRARAPACRKFARALSGLQLVCS
eukprot:scaffold7105_cov116-Isochrysis_galbana.AAC.11